MMTITIKQGDIFESKCDALVCPVNCVGVMGAGLAKAFKERYPEMFTYYRDICKREFMNFGRVYYFTESSPIIMLFPTKYHWKEKSDIQNIKTGLNYIISNHDRVPDSPWMPKSMAFPALGSGLGGLPWEIVKDIMIRKLDCLDIEIEIYEPR